MLHSRLRPLPHARPSTTSAPAPEFDDQDIDQSRLLESPEDLFSSFLPYLFPDDAPSFHGDPGQHLIYMSPAYGDVEIMVPSYPGQSEKQQPQHQNAKIMGHVDEGRRLFAHFLWSAAMVVAEGVERSAMSSSPDDDSDAHIWDVRGESVLELGAG